VSMYLDTRVFNPGISFEEFMDGLKEFDEDDKTAWEKTTNRRSGIAAAMFLLTQSGYQETDNDHVTQVISHLLCPVIKFDKNDCYLAPYKTSSGSLFTLYFNILRHQLGPLNMAVVVQQHGMKTFVEGCGCKYCCLGYKEDITMEGLSRITGGAYMGDDRFRMAYKSEIVQKYVDLALDSITTGGTKKFDEAVFLKTSFRKYDDGSVTIYRDRQRVLSKLVLGEARRCRPHLLAAMCSAAMELGDDEYGNGQIQRLYDLLKFTVDEIGEAGEYAQKYIYRGVAQGDCYRPPNLDVVLARTCTNFESVCIDTQRRWWAVMED